MAKHSAGLIMYRFVGTELQVLLVHPGGPFWAKKDLGAWSIPKGEHDETEEPLQAAIREFKEEIDSTPSGPFQELGSITQASGKIVTAWAFQGDCDLRTIKSNLCHMEWPPRSGHHIEFPEVDRAGWFSIEEARERVLSTQASLVQILADVLGSGA